MNFVVKLNHVMEKLSMKANHEKNRWNQVQPEDREAFGILMSVRLICDKNFHQIASFIKNSIKQHSRNSGKDK